MGWITCGGRGSLSTLSEPETGSASQEALELEADSPTGPRKKGLEADDQLPALTRRHLRRLEARIARWLRDEREERSLSEAALAREISLRAKFEDVRAEADYQLNETKSELSRVGSEVGRLASQVAQLGALAAHVERQEQRLGAAEAAVDELSNAEIQERCTETCRSAVFQAMSSELATGTGKELGFARHELVQLREELAAEQAAIRSRVAALEARSSREFVEQRALPDAEQALKVVLEKDREFRTAERAALDDRLKVIEARIDDGSRRVSEAERELRADSTAKHGQLDRAMKDLTDSARKAEADISRQEERSTRQGAVATALEQRAVALEGRLGALERSARAPPPAVEPRSEVTEVMRARLEAVERRLSAAREETSELLRVRLEAVEQRVVEVISANSGTTSASEVEARISAAEAYIRATEEKLAKEFSKLLEELARRMSLVENMPHSPAFLEIPPNVQGLENEVRRTQALVSSLVQQQVVERRVSHKHSEASCDDPNRPHLQVPNGSSSRAPSGGRARSRGEPRRPPTPSNSATHSRSSTRSPLRGRGVSQPDVGEDENLTKSTTTPSSLSKASASEATGSEGRHGQGSASEARSPKPRAHRTSRTTLHVDGPHHLPPPLSEDLKESLEGLFSTVARTLGQERRYSAKAR